MISLGFSEFEVRRVRMGFHAVFVILLIILGCCGTPADALNPTLFWLLPALKHNSPTPLPLHLPSPGNTTPPSSSSGYTRDQQHCLQGRHTQATGHAPKTPEERGSLLHTVWRHRPLSWPGLLLHVAAQQNLLNELLLLTLRHSRVLLQLGACSHAMHHKRQRQGRRMSEKHPSSMTRRPQALSPTAASEMA